MNLLITSRTEFFGRFLCEKYTNRNNTVLFWDNFLIGDLKNVRNLPEKILGIFTGISGNMVLGRE